MKRALLIGISIGGFLYEIKNMAELLTSDYGYRKEDITILCDNGQYTPPTYKDIHRELNKIVKMSSSCDQIWIYYSGHGLINGSIVTIDQNFITRNEIGKYIQQIRCEACILFDCCNSGKIGSELEWSFEWDMESHIDHMKWNVIHNHSWKIMNPKIIFLCSCHASESSKDIYDIKEDIHQGLFTTAFLNVLKRNKSNKIGILDLFGKIYKEILFEMKIMDQTPTLHCTIFDPNFVLQKQKPPAVVKPSIMSNFHSLMKRWTP
jgi:hypothetical protein